MHRSIFNFRPIESQTLVNSLKSPSHIFSPYYEDGSLRHESHGNGPLRHGPLWNEPPWNEPRGRRRYVRHEHGIHMELQEHLRRLQLVEDQDIARPAAQLHSHRLDHRLLRVLEVLPVQKEPRLRGRCDIHQRNKREPQLP